MKKTPLQIIKLLSLAGAVCIILSLLGSCKKTENYADDKSNTLSLQEAQAAANNIGTQYWQNGNESTLTPEMLDWSNVKTLTVANQANTVCVPIKEKLHATLGFRKLMLAKRNGKILSTMLVVKPTAVYQQKHGSSVSAKDFSGELHFYSAKTGKYIKGARMLKGKWVANLRAMHQNETYSNQVLVKLQAENASINPVPDIPQTNDEPDIPEDNTDHPSPPWEGGGQEYPGEGWDGQPYEDPYQPGEYYEENVCPNGTLVEGQCVTNANYPGKNLGYPYLWWTDQNWIKNNFKFGINSGIPNAPLEELTWEEINLIMIFPFQAMKIKNNVEPAQVETVNRFGINWLNDKSDAFRHTYWLALNTKSVGLNMAKEFSDAHETEVPQKFILEKQMDLHNNSIGMNLNQNGLTNAQLSNLAWNAVVTGACRYLFPVNYNAVDYTTSHGITVQTQLIPTNQ